MREFQPTEIKFTLRCGAEHIPIRGNAMASGDDAADRETEDEIIEDVERGNQWAWGNVTVSASWSGFTGEAHLGGCSYKSGADFRENSGYFKDMVGEALGDLLTEIKNGGWDLIMGTDDPKARAKAHGIATVEVIE